MYWKVKYKKVTRFGLGLSYSLFATGITSGAFGVAYTNISYGLLCIAAVLSFCARPQKLLFLPHEVLSFALFGWLLIASSLRQNPIDGMIFIAQEYRLLATFPVVAILLQRHIPKSELLTPIVCGAIINLSGSLLLIIGEHNSFVNDINSLIGISGDALGGKFVQAWNYTIWMGILLFLILSLKGWKIAVSKFLLIAIACFMFYYLVSVAQSRTGVLGCAIVIFIIFSYKILKITQLKHKIVLMILVSIFGVLSFKSLSETSRFQELKEEVNYFASGKRNSIYTNFGMRLWSWKTVAELERDEVLLGVGGSAWREKMDQWVSMGIFSKLHHKWLDFHSEFIWQLMLGGLPAVTLYVLIALKVLAQVSGKCIASNEIMWGLAVSIPVVWLPMSLFNSNLISIRESHVIIFYMIIFSFWIRGLPGERIN